MVKLKYSSGLNISARGLIKVWAEGLHVADGCVACGYLFINFDEGCDECAPVKAVIEANMRFQHEENEEIPTTHERKEQ